MASFLCSGPGLGIGVCAGIETHWEKRKSAIPEVNANNREDPIDLAIKFTSLAKTIQEIKTMPSQF